MKRRSALALAPRAWLLARHVASLVRGMTWAPGALLTGTALALLCLLQLVALWRAPAVFAPASIGVTLRPGEALVLGQHELGAPQADTRHLALQRDADGDWSVRNVSDGKQLLVRRAGVDRRSGTAALAAGQQFRLGAERFDVSGADQAGVTWSGAGHRWRYDGATLYRDGQALPACPGATFGARLGALWNRLVPLALTRTRPLAFGGNLHCGNRLGVAGIGSGGAAMLRSEGALQLVAGTSLRLPLMMGSEAASADLAQAPMALAGAESLVLGRTRLALAIDGASIVFTPLNHVALFTQAQAKLPPEVTWRWQRRALFALPGGAAWPVTLVAALLLALAGGACWQGGAWPFARGTGLAVRGGVAANLLLVLAGLAFLLLQRAGSAPGLAWSMLLGWAALWACLLLPARLHLSTAAGVLLLAIGLLAQLDLGLGGMESSWLRHYQKTVALLAIGLGLANCLRLRGPSAMPGQARLEGWLVLLAAGALLALLLQLAFGDETGVFDLQPVEFAKVALTALTAHCLAIGLGWHAAMPQRCRAGLRWLRLGAPALVFCALLGLALIQVDDFSPLLLLLVWSMAMALAWALAARSKRTIVMLGAVALGACLAIALLRSGGAGAEWRFYGDRFLVWLDPATHPHTGQQLLVAASAIAEGAWWGADRWLGLASLGQPAGSALHIPAVQDDFAPAFFLNRHGLAGALALWALQALFLVGLLQTAARAFGASMRACDFRQAWLARFRCFTLCGGAAFVLGHLLLSWGTNLAIFPIMGQPMSFLSAGGSHLLFFICPLLAFSAISAQSFEESLSCRSMSNAKSLAR